MKKIMFLPLKLKIFAVSVAYFAFLLCFSPVSLAQERFVLSVYGENGEYKPKESGFLATRVTLTPGTERFGFAPTDESAEYSGAGVSLLYNLDDTPYIGAGSAVFASLDVGNTIDRKQFGVLNPGSLSLLIPGVGVGPNGQGFELPPPNNPTANTFYREDTDHIAFDIGLQKSLRTKNERLNITPFAGVQYRRFKSKTQFFGEVPLFLSRFEYNTDIEVESWSPFIGTQAEYAITPSISLLGSARYLYDFNFGDGRDNLFFTGFGTQSVNMKNDGGSHSAEVQAGISFALSRNSDLSFIANYSSRGNLAIMETRTGTRPSDFEYERGEIVAGQARLTLAF